MLVNRRDRVVARMDVPGRCELPVEDRIVLAVAVADVDAPMIRPLSGEAHELPSGWCVTFWPLAEPVSALSAVEAGALLADLHSCSIPPQAPLGVPPLHVHRRDLEGFFHCADPGIAQYAVSMMSERWTQAVASARAHQPLQRPAVLCHGDFHVGNMVRLDGRLLLCDLDSVCVAPRECDLADVWVYARRFWPAGSWDEFVEVYGDSFDAAWVRLLGLERELVHLRYAGEFVGSSARGPRRVRDAFRQPRRSIREMERHDLSSLRGSGRHQLVGSGADAVRSPRRCGSAGAQRPQASSTPLRVGRDRLRNTRSATRVLLLWRSSPAAGRWFSRCGRLEPCTRRLRRLCSCLGLGRLAI